MHSFHILSYASTGTAIVVCHGVWCLLQAVVHAVASAPHTYSSASPAALFSLLVILLLLTIQPYVPCHILLMLLLFMLLQARKGVLLVDGVTMLMMMLYMVTLIGKTLVVTQLAHTNSSTVLITCIVWYRHRYAWLPIRVMVVSAVLATA
jgi:hypothetical protein